MPDRDKTRRMKEEKEKKKKKKETNFPKQEERSLRVLKNCTPNTNGVGGWVSGALSSCRSRAGGPVPSGQAREEK